MSPLSFSPEIQNPFSGATSLRSGLNMSISGYHAPRSACSWLSRLSSGKSWRILRRSPFARAARSPAMTNRPSSGAGPCSIVSASGSRRLFSGTMFG